MTESAILGAATGYEPEKVQLLLHSLENANFTGRVVLFVHPEQQEEYTKFFANMNFPYSLLFVNSNSGRFELKTRSKKIKKIIKSVLKLNACLSSKKRVDYIYKFSYPHVARFFDYYWYLKSNKDILNVVLTDTRDVIFQKNPFENDINGLYLGLEDSALTIGADSYNKMWIENVYGTNFLNTLFDKTICCAGVTLGDINSILLYLETMIKEFISLPIDKIIELNYDQGIHNKLLYNNEFNNVVLCKPLNSIISTIGVIERKNLFIDDENNLCIENGDIATIVHQYDRHSDIEDIFKQKYLN